MQNKDITVVGNRLLQIRDLTSVLKPTLHAMIVEGFGTMRIARRAESEGVAVVGNRLLDPGSDPPAQTESPWH
jgi:hypothetical protein